jgi:hypothetical protein
MKPRRRPALTVGLEAIERELLDKCGSVSAAARALGVSSVDAPISRVPAFVGLCGL